MVLLHVRHRPHVAAVAAIQGVVPTGAMHRIVAVAPEHQVVSARAVHGVVAPPADTDGRNAGENIIEQVIGRALGRKVRDNTEKLTYSIVIAEKGFEAFVDLVLNSEEYMQRFGYDSVPLEMSRVLPGRAVGEAPVYQEFPRYSYDWQEKLTSNDMMMSIDDHLNFGPTKSFAEKVLYERPSDKAFRYIIPSFVILSGLIVVGIVKVFTSIFVVG